ncbi:MAG: hypothetical protein G01um101416_748 [Microgenomates group bacterium Gr01-1014_16]|nr:MAG: hypothetical protein G01um101416_748 [Microgenomates group bacterium Gr01-1014_16]
MPISTRSIVIIDGSNLYHKLKELQLPHRKEFDFHKFVESVSQKTQIVVKYFCIGKISALQQDQHARQMMADQQSLVTRLQKDGFVIQFGYLLKSDTAYHEKGVDVQMATDLIMNACKNTYDQAFLITSDSDLIPAISAVQSLGKKVTYVGFKHKPSYALLKACNQSILLEKRDL